MPGRDYSFHTSAVMTIIAVFDYDKTRWATHNTLILQKYANKRRLLTPDFGPTQALQSTKGGDIRFVQALIDEYRFDLVILLRNNTPGGGCFPAASAVLVDRKVPELKWRC